MEIFGRAMRGRREENTIMHNERSFFNVIPPDSTILRRNVRDRNWYRRADSKRLFYHAVQIGKVGHIVL
jgi:hypothetical protein